MGFGFQVLGFGGFGTRTTYTSATGGDADPTTIGDYKIHTFNSSGDFTLTKLGDDDEIEYLVVAGAGGGGGRAGGGGAGGYLAGTSTSFSTTHGGDGVYAVVIGAGGAGGSYTNDG